MRVIKRLLATAGTAVLFGAVAVLTAIFLEPHIKSLFGTETAVPPEETYAIVLPKDELETEAPPETETQIPETPAETEPVPEETQESPEEREAEIKDTVLSVMKEYRYTAEDGFALWNAFSEVWKKAERSLVTISVSETDIFDKEGVSPEVYSGAVIAESYAVKYILAVSDMLEDGEELYVTWPDGRTTRAHVEARDDVLHIAVLSVEKAFLTQDTIKNSTPLILGNSYAITRGNPLFVIGSPSGVPESVAYTCVSMIESGVGAADDIMRAVHLDRTIDGSKGSFVINAQGELAGWISLNEDAGSDTMIGISDEKALLERMINHQSTGYFGIVPGEITDSLKEEGAPAGLYVRSVISGSPAYNVGIQPGDIIVQIGEAEILSMPDFRSVLNEVGDDSVMTITVKRESRGDYKEVAFEAAFTVREFK